MRKRAGFTLVELMVVMALTMFILIILTEAFVIGTQTFSDVKVLGELMENLRTSSNVLRGDLAMDHFEGRRKLSDPDISTVRPREGFFNINKLGPYQFLAPPSAGLPYSDQHEGLDADDIVSYKINDMALWFTVRSRGNTAEAFYSAPVPQTVFSQKKGGGVPFLSYSFHHYITPSATIPWSIDATTQNSPTVYKGQWLEVAYFLERTGTSEEPDNPNSILGTPLYNLVRCQYVLIPTTDLVNKYDPAADTIQNNFIATNLYPVTGPSFVELGAVTALPRVALNDGQNLVKFLTPNDVADGILDTVSDIVDPYKDFSRSRVLKPRMGSPVSNDVFGPRAFPQIDNVHLPYTRFMNKQVLLKNVVSFDVTVLRDADAVIMQVGETFGPATPFSLPKVNRDLQNRIGYFERPIRNNPFWPGPVPGKPSLPPVEMFDTSELKWRNTTDPSAFITAPFQISYPIQAIRVTLRAYETKSRQTRQMSFVQDM